MGLDVYLKKYNTDLDTVQAREAEAREKSEQIWAEYPKYEECTQQQKDEADQRVKDWYEENGFDRWGELSGKDVEGIEINSEIDPDNMFKIGYFRSSYNSGGINHVLREQLGGRDLYWIFQPNDEYYVRPDWAMAYGRVQQLIREWGERLERDGSFHINECRYNEFMGKPEDNPIKSEEDVLRVFEAEYEKHKAKHPEISFGGFKVLRASFNTLNLECPICDSAEALQRYFEYRDVQLEPENGDVIFPEPIVVRSMMPGVRPATVMEETLFGSKFIPCSYYVISSEQDGEYVPDNPNFDMGHYSNRDGEFIFSTKGLRVVGIINGLSKRFFVDEKLPVSYAVCENDHNYEWYFKALKIVAETCEWVINQSEPEKFVLHWSG